MKKVLVISYYWPPAGGGGVQRIVKFCKYLKQFEWEPIVLTVSNGDYNSIDESFSMDVEKITTFYAKLLFFRDKYKKNIPSQLNDNVLNIRKKSSKLKDLIRNNIFIPDSKIFWYTEAVNKAKEIIEKNNIDIVYSTSPPYTTQLIL